MTQLNFGTQGAKQQTWSRISARSVLKEVVENSRNPDDREKLLKVFTARVFEGVTFDDDDSRSILKTIISKWFSNEYNYLMRKRSSKASQVEARVSSKAKAKIELAEAFDTQIKVALLDMIMPNGKKLRNCTGAELTVLAPLQNKLLSALVKDLKPKQRVGDVYKTNEQLRALIG